MRVEETPRPRSAVLVHGTFGTPEDWGPVQALLEARGVEAVAPDLPTHRQPDAGLLDDVEEVRAALRSAEWPTVAVGWSYGCDVVGVAAEGQGSVARLLYVSSVPIAAGSGARDTSMFEHNPAVLRDEFGRFVPLGRWWDHEPGLTDAARAHFDAHPRRPSAPGAFSDPIPAAAWMHVPTTVLFGERDAFNGVDPWARAKEHVDDVRVVDCDHFVPFNLPALVADVVLEEIPVLDRYR